MLSRLPSLVKRSRSRRHPEGRDTLYWIEERLIERLEELNFSHELLSCYDGGRALRLTVYTDTNDDSSNPALSSRSWSQKVQDYIKLAQADLTACERKWIETARHRIDVKQIRFFN